MSVLSVWKGFGSLWGYMLLFPKSVRSDDGVLTCFRLLSLSSREIFGFGAGLVIAIVRGHPPRDFTLLFELGVGAGWRLLRALESNCYMQV